MKLLSSQASSLQQTPLTSLLAFLPADLSVHMLGRESQPGLLLITACNVRLAGGYAGFWCFTIGAAATASGRRLRSRILA